MQSCKLCREQISERQRHVERPCCKAILHETCSMGYFTYAESSGSSVCCPICKQVVQQQAQQTNSLGGMPTWPSQAFQPVFSAMYSEATAKSPGGGAGEGDWLMSPPPQQRAPDSPPSRTNSVVMGDILSGFNGLMDDSDSELEGSFSGSPTKSSDLLSQFNGLLGDDSTDDERTDTETDNEGSGSPRASNLLDKFEGLLSRDDLSDSGSSDENSPPRVDKSSQPVVTKIEQIMVVDENAEITEHDKETIDLLKGNFTKLVDAAKAEYAARADGRYEMRGHFEAMLAQLETGKLRERQLTEHYQSRDVQQEQSMEAMRLSHDETIVYWKGQAEDAGQIGQSVELEALKVSNAASTNEMQAAHKAQMQELQGQYEQSVASWRKEAEKLGEAYQDREMELSETARDLEKVRARQQATAEERDEVKQQLDEACREVDRARQDLTSVLQERDSLTQQLASAPATPAGGVSDPDMLAMLRQQLDTMARENADLSQRLAEDMPSPGEESAQTLELEARLAEAVQGLRAKSDECERLGTDLAQMRTDATSMMTETVSLRDELASLQQELALSVSSQGNSEELLGLRTRVAQLEQELREAAVAPTISATSIVPTAAADENGSTDQPSLDRSAVLELESQVKGLEQQLEVEKQAKVRDMAAHLKRIDYLDSVIEDLEAEAHAKEDDEGGAYQIAALREQVKKLQAEHAETTNKMEGANFALESEVEDLKERLEDGVEEAERMAASKDAEIRRLSVPSASEGAADEVESLRQQLVAAELSVEQSAGLEAQVRSMVEEISRLEDETASLHRQQEQQEEQQQQQSTDSTEAEGLKGDIDALESELERVKEELAQAAESHAIEVQGYTQTMGALQAKMQQQPTDSTEVEDLKIDFIALESEVERLNEELAQAAESHAIEIRGYAQLMGEQQAKVNEGESSASLAMLEGLQRDVAVRDAEIEALSQQIAELSAIAESGQGDSKTKLAKYAQAYQKARELAVSLKKSCQELSSDKTELEAKVAALEGAGSTPGASASDTEMEALQIAFNEKTELIDQLNEELVRSNSALQEEKAECAHTKSECEKLVEGLEKAKEVYASMAAELAPMQQVIRAKDAEIAEIRQELDKRQQETDTEEGSPGVAELQMKLAQMTDDKNKLETAQFSLENEIEDLKEQVAEERAGAVIDPADERGASADERDALQAELAVKEDEIKRLSDDFSKLELELYELRSMRTAPEEAAEGDTWGTESTVGSYFNPIEGTPDASSSKEPESLKQQLSQLQEQFALAKESQQGFAQEASASESRAESLESANEELSQKVATLEASQSEAGGDDVEGKTKARLEAKIEKFSQGFQKAKALCGTLKEKCQTLSIENADLLHKVGDLESRTDSFADTSHGGMREGEDGLREQVTFMGEHIVMLSKDNEAFQRQVEELRTRLEGSGPGSAEELGALEVNQLKEQVRYMADENLRIKSEMESLRQEPTEVPPTSGIDSYFGAAEGDTGATSGENSDHLRQQLSQMQAEMESLKEQLQNTIPSGDGEGSLGSYFGTSDSTQDAGNSEVMESLREQLSLQQEQIEVLENAKTAELQTSLTSSQAPVPSAEVEELRTQIASMSEDLTRLENANFELESQVEDLREQVVEGQELLEEGKELVRTRAPELEAVPAGMAGGVEGHLVEKAKRMSVIASYSKEAVDLRDQIAQLTDKLEAVAASQAPGTDDESAEASRAQAQQIEQLERTKFELNGLVDKLKEQLKEQLVEAEDGTDAPMGVSKDGLAALQIQLADKEVETQRLLGDISTLETELARLRVMPHAPEETVVGDGWGDDSAIGSYFGAASNAQSAGSSEEAESLREQVSQLQLELETMRQQLQNAIPSGEGWGDDSYFGSSEGAQGGDSSAEVETLRQQVLQLEEQLTVAQKSRPQDEGKSSVPSAEVEELLRARITTMTEELTRIENANFELEGQVEDLREQVLEGQELEALDGASASEAADLRQQIAQLTTELESGTSTAEMEASRHQVLELQAQLSEAHDSVSASTRIVASASVIDSDELRAQIMSMSENVEQLESTNFQLTGQMQELREQLAEAEEVKNTSTDASADLLMELRTQIADKENTIQNLSGDVHTLETELGGLRERDSPPAEASADDGWGADVSMVSDVSAAEETSGGGSSEEADSLRQQQLLMQAEIESLKQQLQNAIPPGDGLGGVDSYFGSSKSTESTGDSEEIESLRHQLVQLQEKIAEAQPKASTVDEEAESEALRAQITTLSKHAERLENANFTLEGQVEELREQLEEGNRYAEREVQHAASLSEQVSSMTEEKRELETAQTALEGQLEDLRQQLVEAKDFNESSGSEVAKLKEDLAASAIEVEEAKASAGRDSALKAKLEKYVQGFTKAKELITTLKGKCQSLAAENTELETKLASTEESEASGLREQIGGLESANFKLESEVQELKDQVAETEDGPIDTSQDLRAELQEQVATAEAEIKRLSNELFLRPEQEDFAIRSIPLDESEIVADLKRQVEELQDQLRGSASASGSVATSSVFPDESPYKRAKLLSMQQLQGDVKSLEAELKTAHARNAEADAQFKMLSELRVSMEAQVKKLDGVLFREGMTAEELQDIIRNHKTLQAANAAQEAELSEMRGEAADAAENRSHLEEQVQPLGTEIEVLESARSVLGSEAGALREELENGRRDAAVELEAVNQEVAVKAEELEELRKELASLNSAAQAAANTESELQVKLDKYMQGFAKAKELIGTLKVKNQGLTDTNAGLSEKVASLALSPEALEGMQRDVATKDAELEEMKETHAMNLQKSTQAIEDLQAQLTGSAENGAALEGLKLDVAEKGSELEHLKTQHAETVELHAAKVQEYLQTIGNLEAVSSKNLGDLHAAVAAKETEIEQLKAEYAAQPASDEVGELQQKLNEYTQDFAEAKEMSATLTQQCQNLTAENEALQQKLVSLEASQGAKETGGAEGEDVLRQQIKAMNADLSTLEGTNFSLESEVEDLREQLQEAQENGSSSSSSSSSSSGFSAEMVDLKEQIAAKDAEILELRAGTVVAEGNEEIKAKLEKYMAGFAKAKELCGTLREKVKGLTATNMELQGKVADADDLQAKLDKFTLGFTKAKELSVTLKEKNRDLTVANTELQEKLASLEETPVESTTTEMLGSQQDESGEIDALRQQVSELTEQLMVERATLEAEAKASTALLDGVVQGLHENVREHAAIIDTLREELVTKEDSRASADGEAAVAGGGEELKAKLEKYMQGFQKAKAACGTLKERCQGLTAANAELQQKVASADELQAKLDKYTQGFAKAKEMCAGLKEQCTALTAEKEALQAHIASLPSSDLAAPAAIYTKLDEYIVVCGVLEEKCELLTSQNTELQDKLSSLEALGTISVGDVELKAKLEKYVQAFNKAKELCTTLKEKAKSLEGANTELQDKVTLLETGSQEMHATCQKLTADNGTLQETVANLEAGQGSKVAGGSEDAEALRQKIKSLKDEMSNLGGTNFSLESEVEDLREQLAEAQQDGGGGDSNVNSEEVATLKTQIAALVAEILELRAVAGGDEFSSEEVNSMIQEQIAAKEEQFSELRRAAGGSDELRAMIDRLREQLDEALQGGDGNEGDSEELAILKEAMAAKDSEIEQLREELDGSTVEADARLEELRSLTSASEASSAVETELKAKLAKYSEGFAKAKELVGTHKKKCQDLENDNAALEDANAALRQKLISLSASPKKVVELQGKLDKYQQGFAKAQELFPEEVEVLRQQIASMNEDMNKLEGTNFSLESELGDLREQLEEAQLEGIPKSATSDDSSEIDALKAAVAAKEAEIEQLRAGLIEADELDQLRGELSNASEAATAAESELEAKVEKYTQEYYKSKELCGTLNEKCIVLIAENAALQEKVASLEPPKAAGVTDGNKTEVDDLREKIALMTAGLAKSKEMMQSLSDQLQSKEEELERIRVGAGSTSGPLDLTKRVKELEAEVGGMQFSFEAEREDMEESHASKVAELQRQIAVMDAQAPTEGGGDKEELANAERKYAELLEERSIADAHAASYKEEVASLKSKLAVITEQQSGRSDEDSSKGSMEEMVSNLGMAKAECEELQANMHNKEVELIQLREFLTARDAEIVALGQRKSQVEMGQGDSQLADRIRVLEEALVASKEEVGGLQFSFDAELEDVQETNAAKIVALEQRISKLSSGARNTNGGDPEALAALELTLAAERHHLLEERSAADAQMAVHKEEVANLQSKIAALTDEIASLREVADEAEESGLQAQLQSKEGELVELRTAVWDKDTEIVGLSQYLSQAESSAVELGAELAELREAVAAKDAEAKEHSVWSQRSAELQLTVGELRSTVEKRDETIATLRAEVVPDASIAARVQELEAELEEKARALKEAATSVEAMGSELQQQNAEMLELQGRGATVSSEGGSAASEEMEALRAERDSLSEKLEKVVVAFKASKESQKDGGKSEIKKLKGKLAKLLEVWKATKAEVDELRGQTAQEAAESGPGDTPVKSTSPEREAKEVASPDSAASDGAAPVATVALLGLQADVARLQQALADSQSASEQEKRGLSEELKLVRAQATKFEEQARHAQAQAQELQAQQRSPVTTSVKADPEAAKKLAMREQEVSRLRGKLQVLQAGVDDRERFINLMSNKLESVTGDLEKEKIMCESKVAAAKEAAGKKKGGWFGGKKAEVVDENEGKEWDGRQWVVPSEAPALPPMPPRPKPIKLVDSPEMGSMAAPVGLSSSASMPLLPPPPSNKYGAVQGRKFVNAFAGDDFGGDAPPAAAPPAALMPSMPSMPMSLAPMMPAPLSPSTAPASPTGKPAESAIKEPANDAIAETESELPAIASPFALPPAKPSFTPPAPTPSAATTASAPSISSEEVEALRDEIKQLKEQLEVRGAEGGDEDDDESANEKDPAKACRLLRRQLARNTKLLKTSNTRTRQLEQQMAKVAPSVRGAFAGAEGSAALPAAGVPTPIPLPGVVSGDPANKEELTKARGQITLLESEVGRLRSEVQKLTDQLSRAPPPQQALRSMPAPTTASPAGQNGADDERSRAELDRAKGVLEKLASKLNAMGSEVRPELGAAPPSPLSDPAGFEQWSTRLLDALARIPKASASTVSPVPAPARTTSSPALPASAMTSTTAVTPSSLSPSLLAALSRATTGVVVSTSPFFMSTVVLMVVAVVFPELAPLLEGFV